MKVSMMDQIEDGITLIALEGRMDSDGALEIDDRFSFASSTRAGK